MKYLSLKTAFVVTSVFCIASVSAKETLSTFATNLSSLRDDCAAKAEQSRNDDFKARSDAEMASKSDNLQASLDARVYAVGHGSHETYQYYLDRSLNDAKKDAERYKEIAQNSANEAQSVKQCISDAKEKGKNAYAYYKDNRANKKLDKDAETLVITWMSNLEEISMNTPQGGESTRAAWNAARIKAQL